MLTNIQRIRNLTTGILHTEFSHVVEDVEFLLGENGLMTHQFPGLLVTLNPFLHGISSDERFWNGILDLYHVGEIEVKPLNYVEKLAFWIKYSESLDDKEEKL